MTSAFPVKNRHLFYLFLLSLILISPALFAGFMGDDHMHMALLKPGLPVNPPADASLYGLFSFMDADPIRNKQLMDLGLIPWWTFPEMKYAFWRPISELTHGLDSMLWAGNAILMHLHNLIWYLVLSLMVFKLYRSQYSELPGKLLLIGFALYLLDASHGFTLSWIANRNGLIAATFGIASIYTYIKSREESSITLQFSSLAFLLLALLSAELGISAVGYIGAYALFRDKSGWLKGCLATIPHLLVVVMWWVSYKSLGFGAANADAYYLDPIASPLVFLTTLGQRLTILFGSQWGLIPAEIFGFSGGARPITNITLVIAGIFCLLVLAFLLPLLKESAKARFWLFGSLFSAFPVCSALPHDRLLLFIGVGASGVIIELLNRGHQQARASGGLTSVKVLDGQSKPTKVFLSFFLFIHLFISSLALPLMAYSPKLWASQIDTAPGEFSSIDNLEQKKLVLFNVPIGSSMAITIWRYNDGASLPDKIWPLSNNRTPITITTKDKNTLLIEKSGGFVQKEEESVRKIESQPFSEGETIKLTGLTLTVLSITEDKRPLKIEALFENPVEDEQLLFLNWDKETKSYEEITIPTIGESVSIGN